ncbi:hypothetical protein EWM64_g9360 [Hericium alpestre]|uniref:DUF6535 domain-containing protein n=1 Tax=Hericium alpestre TaxID=135208 RepID=A0A4Y9ZIY3_9AGAM|nr:hypothetical protein EWM64_g9360 [Hericium alpestre]
MVVQDHFDGPYRADTGTESDGGGNTADPGSAPDDMHSVELGSTAQGTGSARGAHDLAAVGSKEHTPSLDRARGTALPSSESENAGSMAVCDEDSSLAYATNSRCATDSGAAAAYALATESSGGSVDSGSVAANAPVAESSGGAVNSRTAAGAAVPAAEITSDADESDTDDMPPARRSIPQPSRKKMRRDGGFLPATKGFSAYNPDDYEQKYPPDHPVEAMGPNARIWRVYLDEAALRDNDVIEGWRDTTDVLLVFAGLFSAVVTTFVVQSSQSLQPDNAQATVTLLSELIDVQRAISLGISPDTVPHSQQQSAVGPASSDRWVNGLWFISLALSLAAALMAMLVKQWIQYYVHPIAGTIQRRVQTTHFRFIGLENWHVPAIIEFLPIEMHLALLLFFIGLVIFTKGLDNGISV